MGCLRSWLCVCVGLVSVAIWIPVVVSMSCSYSAPTWTCLTVSGIHFEYDTNTAPVYRYWRTTENGTVDDTRYTVSLIGILEAELSDSQAVEPCVEIGLPTGWVSTDPEALSQSDQSEGNTDVTFQITVNGSNFERLTFIHTLWDDHTTPPSNSSNDLVLSMMKFDISITKYRWLCNNSAAELGFDFAFAGSSKDIGTGNSSALRFGSTYFYLNPVAQATSGEVSSVMALDRESSSTKHVYGVMYSHFQGDLYHDPELGLSIFESSDWQLAVILCSVFGAIGISLFVAVLILCYLQRRHEIRLRNAS
ncbi:hypothetical protein Pelo_14496 [Pelomyxa schiedti]|nr:hypothetical protein Pelo_14496 [Pelomyxa schiedti]